MHRPVVPGLVAASACLLAAVGYGATRGDEGRPLGPRSHPPHVPPGGSVVVPAAATSAGCFGQSIRGGATWFGTAGTAVLGAEKALPGAGPRGGPAVPVEPPGGDPHDLGAGRFSDGGWTFRVRHDDGRGWSVTDVTYCPPGS